MRQKAAALIAPVASALTLLCPPALGAQSLPTGSEARSIGVTSPDTRAIATLIAPGQIQVQTPGAVERRFAVSENCQPAAMAPGSLLIECLGPAPGYEQLDLSTTELSPVKIGKLDPNPETQEHFRLIRAGRSWLRGEMDLTSDNAPSALTVPVIVNRTTGAVIDLTGRFTPAAKSWGSRRYVDLSRPRPDRRLCSPVKRSRVAGSYGDLLKVGDWTLRETQRPSNPPAINTVQRCGSPRRLHLGERAAPVLGRDFLAWFHDSRELRVRDLRRARTRSFSIRGRTAIAFSANRLVVSERRGQRWLIHLVRLA